MNLRVDWRASCSLVGTVVKWLSVALLGPLAVALYHGDGWQPKPDNAQDVMGTDQEEGSGGGSFDIETDIDADSVEHPTEDEVDFAEAISEKLAGTGATPDEAFESKGGLEGVVGNNADQFGVTPDVEAIRTVIYENVSHLDAGDLDAE